MSDGTTADPARAAFEAGFRIAMRNAPPRLVPDGPPRVSYTHYDGNDGPRGRKRHVDHPMRVATDADLDADIERAWSEWCSLGPGTVVLLSTKDPAP